MALALVYSMTGSATNQHRCNQPKALVAATRSAVFMCSDGMHERRQTCRLRDALRERNVRNIWASDPESEVDEEEEEGEGDEEVDADEEDDEMLDIVKPT